MHIHEDNNMYTHEILDRFELLYGDQVPILSDLRRAIIDEDISSIFRVAEEISSSGVTFDELRKTVMEENLHAMFRTLKIFTNNKKENKPIEELRKAITEKNHRSIFRVFDNFESNEQLDDLRKAITEKNLYSIFKVLEGHSEGKTELEDLRKMYTFYIRAGEELNLHSLFRLLPGFVKKAPLEELRKAIVEDNLHSLFRLIGDDFEDLRKAIVEENLHSIFRILEEYQKQELIPLSIPLDDLRKAMLEQNIHAIFRLLPRIDSENRTLPLIRRFVINKGKDGAAHIRIKELFGLIGLFHEPILLDTLLRVINTYPDANIRDAYSRGQILSKQWVTKELQKIIEDPVDTTTELGTVFLCAGWYGTLALMLFESGMKITKIRSFDIDDEAWPIAETINRPYVMNEWQFKAQTEDIHNINYLNGHHYPTRRRDGEEKDLYDVPDTIINTSCEHIDNFTEWYDGLPRSRLLILQTTDYEGIHDHVNCITSIDEFKKMCPMRDVKYEGVLNLDKYNRYMLIGLK